MDANVTSVSATPDYNQHLGNYEVNKGPRIRTRGKLRRGRGSG
jgi:hypothetical protein